MIASHEDIKAGDIVAINPNISGKKRILIRITHMSPVNPYAPEHVSFLGYRVRPTDLSVSFGYEHAFGGRYPLIEVVKKS